MLGLKEAAKLVGYVCGIVLLDHNAHPWSYAWYRFVETVIGIAAAVTVSVIPKLLKVDELTGDPSAR
jgi:F0F1-type ATP synthase assembly protein I